MADLGQIKIRNHAIAVHERMQSTAVMRDNVLVWQGSVSALLKELGIPQGYQTIIVRLLTVTNCLDQIRRGTGTVPSVYALTRTPTVLVEDDWPSIRSIVKSPPDPLTAGATPDKLLVQEVRNLAERLPRGVNLGKALIELQSQINDLRKRITELEQKLAQQNKV